MKRRGTTKIKIRNLTNMLETYKALNVKTDQQLQLKPKSIEEPCFIRQSGSNLLIIRNEEMVSHKEF